MSEQIWLTTTDPSLLIERLRRPISDRYLRLIACSCCRRLWASLTQEIVRQAIIVAEKFADGRTGSAKLHASKLEVQQVWTTARQEAEAQLAEEADSGEPDSEPIASSHAILLAVTERLQRRDVVVALERAAQAVALTAIQTTEDMDEVRNIYDAAKTKERGEQASLVRHILGNPFRSPPDITTWPSSVVQLAESLYDGQDCRLPLSDALEEAGQSELAEHFRKEEWHPKGCWALDFLLGKG